jgi:Pilus assembly protein, PilO
MSITDRDRKILLALIPIVAIVGYWFLLLAPKRQEATRIQDQLTQAQSERDTAVEKASNLTSAKKNFASDYAAVIYLGKSIPSNVDTSSLLVQLDRAARGTGIDFKSIQTGTRASASASGASSSSSAPAASGSGTPANGGSGPATSTTPAQSAPGTAAQSAGNAVNTSNNASAAAGASNGSTGTDASAGSSQTALDSVPLDFDFRGSFYDLAEFFHRMKRFVRVANNQIVVRGRLITINSFSFDTKDTYPQVKATVHATVYLAPKAQGVSAGATSSGPAGAPAAPAGQTASTSSPTPAATVTAP